MKIFNFAIANFYYIHSTNGVAFWEIVFHVQLNVKYNYWSIQILHAGQLIIIQLYLYKESHLQCRTVM